MRWGRKDLHGCIVCRKKMEVHGKQCPCKIDGATFTTIINNGKGLVRKNSGFINIKPCPSIGGEQARRSITKEVKRRRTKT